MELKKHPDLEKEVSEYNSIIKKISEYNINDFYDEYIEKKRKVKNDKNFIFGFLIIFFLITLAEIFIELNNYNNYLMVLKKVFIDDALKIKGIVLYIPLILLVIFFLSKKNNFIGLKQAKIRVEYIQSEIKALDINANVHKSRMAKCIVETIAQTDYGNDIWLYKEKHTEEEYKEYYNSVLNFVCRKTMINNENFSSDSVIRYYNNWLEKFNFNSNDEYNKINRLRIAEVKIERSKKLTRK